MVQSRCRIIVLVFTFTTNSTGQQGGWWCQFRCWVLLDLKCFLSCSASMFITSSIPQSNIGITIWKCWLILESHQVHLWFENGISNPIDVCRIIFGNLVQSNQGNPREPDSTVVSGRVSVSSEQHSGFRCIRSFHRE